MKPKQIQTSLLSGMEFIYSGEVKAHITLTKEIALNLIKLSHTLNKPMTKIVSEALEVFSNRNLEKLSLHSVLI